MRLELGLCRGWENPKPYDRRTVDLTQATTAHPGIRPATVDGGNLAPHRISKGQQGGAIHSLQLKETSEACPEILQNTQEGKYPDPWEDLESITPNMFRYTTIGYFLSCFLDLPRGQGSEKQLMSSDFGVSH